MITHYRPYTRNSKQLCLALAKYSRIFVFTTCAVQNINTSRTTWIHCHVYRVNRGCPCGHMLVTHWSKNALLRNLPGDSNRAAGRQNSCKLIRKFGGQLMCVSEVRSPVHTFIQCSLILQFPIYKISYF